MSQSSCGRHVGRGGSVVTLVTSSGAPADTTPPSVSGMSPAVGATGVSTSTTVSGDVQRGDDRGVDQRVHASCCATRRTSWFRRRSATTRSTRVATLTPSQALGGSTSYTSTIIGGSAGVKDAAGNAMAANYVASFTTAAAPVPPPPTPTPGATSIFCASAAPTTFATSDGSAVELGVKFRSDVAGTVTGVRFYKGTGTTGTHTGTLWSSTGTKLATATFTGGDRVGLAAGVVLDAGRDHREHRLRRVVSHERRPLRVYPQHVRERRRRQRSAARAQGGRQRRERRLPLRQRRRRSRTPASTRATTGSTSCSWRSKQATTDVAAVSAAATYRAPDATSRNLSCGRVPWGSSRAPQLSPASLNRGG